MEFIDHSSETTELAKALIQVQRQMQSATKDAKNPFTRSNYATLNSVMDSYRDALLNNNIWLCQYPVPVEQPECIGLMTKLTHTESSQWQASLAVVPLPRADPQGMGSAITYARRYAIIAMLCMITEDDNGEGAKKKTANSGKSRGNAICRAKTQPDFAEAAQEEMDLPKMEGVIFQVVSSQDGRDCIIASANTQPNRSQLSQEGLCWHPQRKDWWKYADAI